MRFVRSLLAGRILAITVLLGSTLVTYLATVTWRASNAAAEARFYGGGGQDVDADGSTPANPFASANGTHLVAFVLTASDCGWSSLPASMEVIGNIRERVRTAHGDSYAQVTVVGVALDRDLEAGVRFLSDIGKGNPGQAFDQIMIGGSWLNEQVVRFSWRDRVAQAATPSIILVERSVNTEAYLSTSTIDVQADELVLNLNGRTEIGAWMNAGAPLNHPGDIAPDGG